MAKKRWVTLVGEYAPATVSPVQQPELKPYWLERTSSDLLEGIAIAQRLEAAERERLLYERGGGAARPTKPDDRPEPRGQKRSKQKGKRKRRKPRLWTGQKTDGAEV